MPEDGSYGWRITVSGGEKTALECFRVVADEEIGKAQCQWEDSRGKKGEAHFAPDPKRRNVWFFCVPRKVEPEVCSVARVFLYSREKIRVDCVEPTEEPPNLMKMVRRAFTNFRTGERKPFSYETSAEQSPKRSG